MNDPAGFQPRWSFWVTVPVAGLLTWALHELAHFQTGRWLGYGMWVSLNQAGPLEGSYDSVRDRICVAMAGPIVTYVQAGVALWLLRKHRIGAAYPFLFFAWFTRTVAFAVSFGHPNDEARTSLDLGLPLWVLPAVAATVLLLMTALGSRALRVGWRTNVVLYLVASVLTAAVVFSDPLLGRLLEG